MLKELYGDDLLIVVDGSKLKNTDAKKLVIVRNGAELKEVKDCLCLHYEDDFEQYLNFKVPSKTRKPGKFMSLSENYEVLDQILYGSLGFEVDGIPYVIGINHIVLGDKIFFHCARKGFKLAAINKNVCFNVVDDLGRSKIGTHNFRSVQIFGSLKQIEDHDIKKKALERLIEHTNPNHTPYVEEMQQSTMLLELDVDYMIGKKNIF